MDPTPRAVLLTLALIMFIGAAFRSVRSGRVLDLLDLVAAGLAVLTFVAVWDAWAAV